jgi:chromosome segregation ATPase
MFSKYLEYSEPAGKAHQTAQGECEQKDVIIGQLKSEVAELRLLEGDYHRLNELIASLEGKYSLLLAEKERAEREQRYLWVYLGASSRPTSGAP